MTEGRGSGGRGGTSEDAFTEGMAGPFDKTGNVRGDRVQSGDQVFLLPTWLKYLWEVREVERSDGLPGNCACPHPRAGRCQGGYYKTEKLRHDTESGFSSRTHKKFMAGSPVSSAERQLSDLASFRRESLIFQDMSGSSLE